MSIRRTLIGGELALRAVIGIIMSTLAAKVMKGPCKCEAPEFLTLWYNYSTSALLNDCDSGASGQKTVIIHMTWALHKLLSVCYNLIFSYHNNI